MSDILKQIKDHIANTWAALITERGRVHSGTDGAEMRTFHNLVAEMRTCSDSQLSSVWQKRCQDLLDSNPSDLECYHLLDSISQLPETEASRFVTALCDVRHHYPEPKEQANE